VTSFPQLRHPLIDDALDLAARWCEGHIIYEAPALAHAVKVVVTLCDFIPNAPGELVAAVFLHDAPSFVPDGVDLDSVLTRVVGPDVTRTVRALERVHAASVANADPADPWTLQASVADMLVDIDSVLRRSAFTTDPATFWERHAPFVERLGYLRAYCDQARPHLPSNMAGLFRALVILAADSTTDYRQSVARNSL